LFREAIAQVLQALIEQHGGDITQAHQDEIVAIMASVVFPANEIEMESVQRQRQRERKREGRAQRRRAPISETDA
jgi:hypothetical protein